jgi:hypothetical protein
MNDDAMLILLQNLQTAVAVARGRWKRIEVVEKAIDQALYLFERA